VLQDAPDHKVKEITVTARHRLSYQRHERRAEHWFIVSGEGVLTLDGQCSSVGPGTAVDIPISVAHRIESVGPGDLVFVEVQHGDYFGVDDIERIEDDFGRADARS
jgi:mannose-6-phosphate isomerase